MLTGMRRGEMLSLKWEQIRNGFIYLTETKSGKARQIPSMTDWPKFSGKCAEAIN